MGLWMSVVIATSKLGETGRRGFSYTIQYMMDTVKEISYAFSYSAERSGRFKTVLKGANATLPAGAHDYVDSL
jgi:hypothetical protein